MRRVMVRYTIKPEHVADNERYVRAVFAELARDRPAGLHYATFKLADGASFMHVASIDTTATADGKNPLLALAAFRELTSTIGARCVEPPVTTELETIGAYRLFEAQ